MNKKVFVMSPFETFNYGYSSKWRMCIMLYELDSSGEEISRQIVISHADTTDRQRLEDFINKKAQEYSVKIIEYTDERIKNYFSEDMKTGYVFKKHNLF